MAVPGGPDGEVGEARRAAAAGEEASGQPTIFSKIIARSVPATILYEDDKVAGTLGPPVPTGVGFGKGGWKAAPMDAGLSLLSHHSPGSAWFSAMWPPKPPSTSW